MTISFDHQTFTKNKAHLNAAFRDLRKQGFLAKQDFTCCQSCGVSDLMDEAEFLAQTGRDVKGGIFYHMQDTDNLREDGRCHIAYVSFDLSKGTSDAALEEAAIVVGQVAVETLLRHGVKTEWDGTVARRIGIDLTGEEGAEPTHYMP